MQTPDDTECEYTLIDHTGLVHGPFADLRLARDRAEELSRWEIINGDGNCIDWSTDHE